MTKKQKIDKALEQEFLSNKKLAKNFIEHTENIMRVYHRKAHDKFLPKYTVKCGCCNKKVEIYYDKDCPLGEPTLEINGVLGTVRNWRAILLPLLGIEKKK